MTSTDHDLRLLAARVRPFFEADLHDTAEDLAFDLARHVGIYTKLLRPDTTLTQIFAWLRAVDRSASARDDVDSVMFLEEALAFEIPDALAFGPDSTTFRNLVELRVRSRRAA